MCDKDITDNLTHATTALNEVITMVENDEEHLKIISELEKVMYKLIATHLQYIQYNLNCLTHKLCRDSIKGKLLEKSLLNLWKEID